ncbi:hypothetical protein MWU59_14295 [Flavobacteriaceae bacterium F08102]|nr:hypothetical protein [Flavobacteriaceae bacterium F08102]
MDNEKIRINNEWVSVNAIRELLKIATHGDYTKSTYDVALELGGELYPELLSEENSLLRKERQSTTAKEFIQRAKLKSIQAEKEIFPVDLIAEEIIDIQSLIALESEKRRNDQLNLRLKKLIKAKDELGKTKHTENQLIFRDAYNVNRKLPVLFKGQSSLDYELPNSNNLRIRVLHPDKPEHITGADLVYEYHHKESEKVSLVFIQYKIWENKKMYLSDPRLVKQLDRLRKTTCDKGLCECKTENKGFRFPFCSSFLRPTDALQSVNQNLISTGEHIPICVLDKLKNTGSRGGEYIDYKGIKEHSISGLLFEELFNRGKIGSKSFTYSELEEYYKSLELIESGGSVIIYAQELN